MKVMPNEASSHAYNTAKTTTAAGVCLTQDVRWDLTTKMDKKKKGKKNHCQNKKTNHFQQRFWCRWWRCLLLSVLRSLVSLSISVSFSYFSCPSSLTEKQTAVLLTDDGWGGRMKRMREKRKRDVSLLLYLNLQVVCLSLDVCLSFSCLFLMVSPLSFVSLCLSSWNTPAVNDNVTSGADRKASTTVGNNRLTL